MTQKYPGGFVTLTPPTQDPALGAATPGIWTLDQALNAEVTRSWPMYDPYYKNVVLNLHGEGTNGAQNNTFLDASSNNFTITRNGNITQGSFSPYGQNYSNYFDGSGDYLSVADNAALDLAAGDFTIEGWINTSSSAEQIFAAQWTGASNRAWVIALTPSSSTFLFAYTSNGSTQVNTSATASLPLNSWVHIALCRSSTTLNFFVNGVLVGTASIGSSTIYNASGSLLIGAYDSGTTTFSGYISNFRIVKGTAAYTSNFTPSTAPLTAISGTSLLTCQSNRFVDNSASPLTITPAGNTAVQRFQPFLFNTSYTPSTIGGSGYFDGTGDYLNTATSANLAIGSGNMTIECWFYPLVPASSRQQWLFDFRTSGSESTTRLYAYIGESDGILYAGFGGFDDQSSGTPIKNAWNHMAIVRSGSGSNNVAVYLNGTRTKQLTDTTNFSTSTQAYVGKRYLTPGSIEYMVGYLCDTRFVKGTAVYDPSVSTLTLPTAPLTAITNTQLLLGYTNSGIYDNAMMNDLETVGNAQISTSVKKYGTGSMAFDGSGDWLSAPDNAVYNFGTGDFTIECWLYPTASGVGTIVAKRSTTSVQKWMQLYYDSTNKIGVVVSFDGSTWGINSLGSTTVSLNTWTHIALVRSGSSFKTYINGVVDISASSSSSINYTNDALTVGAGSVAGGQTLTGYIDDLRITKGVARYVANFTPPTSQLQDQ